VRRPVTWSREALDDIKEQVAFIALDNPAAARRVADRIRDAGKALGEMATGRLGRLTGSYEKSVARLPYIVAYKLQQIAGRESVVILHVIHAARDWPDEEWPR
jgi:plasmid stabilization system protein ParE